MSLSAAPHKDPDPSKAEGSLGAPQRVETVLDPITSLGMQSVRRPLLRRTKWAIVVGMTLVHPVLLYLLYPVAGDATNTMVLAGPVVATLLFSIRVGVLFIVFNTAVSGLVFWHLTAMPMQQGMPKAFVSLLVTTAVCWGADRLRHYIEQRRAMEAALRQAQKIEAIGRLAAGVAHDINNTLNAIMGSTFALRHELSSLGRSFPDLENIALACDRGAQLTRNLLGFARKSHGREETFSLNGVVRQVQQLLTRTTRKELRFEAHLAEPAPLVVGDEAQLEHAVMNLCLNGIDAMEGKGTLSLTTSVRDGHATLSVSDTGTGMDERVRARAFEPFFTTKPLGKGTGMGLSMVYGTVQTMHGSIALATELELGTTITLVFPQAGSDAPPMSSPSTPADPALLDGLTILLVDDEPLVLRAGTRMLRALGCQVLPAKGARDALELFQAHRESISLSVIDLVMPEKDGWATLEAILALRPDAPVLLASGYPLEPAKLEALGRAQSTVRYLAKPYDAKSLLSAVAPLLSTLVTSPPSSHKSAAG